MPSLEFFLVCRSVSIDVHTDEITLSGVLEDVELENDGFVLVSRAVAVGSWNVAPEDRDKDFQALLRIQRPGDTEWADFPVNLSKGRHRFRALFAIENIPLDKPGDLLFELLLNAHHAAIHRVIVHKAGDRASQQDALFPKGAESPPSAASAPTGTS